MTVGEHVRKKAVDAIRGMSSVHKAELAVLPTGIVLLVEPHRDYTLPRATIAAECNDVGLPWYIAFPQKGRYPTYDGEGDGP